MDSANVVVFETDDGFQMAMAKGLLQDSGIPFNVPGQITTLVTDVDPFLKKWLTLVVPSECEEEARELLEPLLHPENCPPEEGENR